MDCLFVEREQKSANTQVPACPTCDCLQLLCSCCWGGLHIVPCMAQGVSGKVKERMAAAGSGTDGGARPMLLFPEVNPLCDSLCTARSPTE